MLPNLVVGQTLTVKPAYFGLVNPFTLSKITTNNRLPDYGQIVIARFPYSADVQYVKRVVALPGDKISLTSKGVFLNDSFMPFQLLIGEQSDGATHIMEIGSTRHRVIIDSEKKFNLINDYQVPDGSVYLLGDNLTGSVDSRELGAFKVDNLLAIANQ